MSRSTGVATLPQGLGEHIVELEAELDRSKRLLGALVNATEHGRLAVPEKAVKAFGEGQRLVILHDDLARCYHIWIETVS